MERFRIVLIEIKDLKEKKIEIVENFGTIERINGFAEIVAIESPIAPLFICDLFKIPTKIIFNNFRKNNDGTLSIFI